MLVIVCQRPDRRCATGVTTSRKGCCEPAHLITPFALLSFMSTERCRRWQACDILPTEPQLRLLCGCVFCYAALTINDHVYMINTGPESSYDGTNNGETSMHTSQVWLQYLQAPMLNSPTVATNTVSACNKIHLSNSGQALCDGRKTQHPFCPPFVVSAHLLATALSCLALGTQRV